MTTIPEKIKQNMIYTMEQMSLASPRIDLKRSPEAILYESDLAHPLYNRVLAYHAEMSNKAGDDIKEIADHYRANQVPFTWLTWSHDPNESELAQALEKSGLKKVEEVCGMSLSFMNWSYQMPAIPGFVIKPVQSTFEMAGFREIVPTVFGLEGEAGEVFSQVNEDAAFAEKAAFRHYVGFQDGQPTAAVTAVYDGETIGIYNVATLKEFRQRGRATLLTAHALREGQAAGGRLAVLQASKMGENIYRSIGFNTDVHIGFYLG